MLLFTLFVITFCLPHQTYLSSTLEIKTCLLYTYRDGDTHVLLYTIFPRHLTHSPFLSRNWFLVFKI